MERGLQKSEEYLGVHMGPIYTEKRMRQDYRHPIFLYQPNVELDDKLFHRLEQTVQVYKHNLADFVINTKKIIKHYVNYIGTEHRGFFTLGQSIRFTVYPGQKEPFQLSLFQFMVNYSMLIGPVICGVDLHDWKPFSPIHWTNSAWVNRMNEYIRMCRPYGNNRKIGECLSWSKHLMDLWVAKVGYRMGLSISNNEFIELTERDEESRDSIFCQFPIPEDLAPSQVERLLQDRTSKLLSTISKQTDLSISVYAQNGLLNPKQAMEYAVNIPYKPDLYGNTIPFLSRTNVLMGLRDIIAYIIDASGGRKAEILKLNVSDAGALERSLCMLMSRVRYVDTDYECNSRYFRKKLIETTDALDKLDGRVCTLDPNSDEYLIIDPKNTDLIGKLLYIKTPITCTHPRRKEGYICSACYGKLMASLNRDIHIGRVAALNLSDEIVQKLLAAKHALATNTFDVQFDREFNDYFVSCYCQVFFNQDMVDFSVDDPEHFSKLYLEFNLANMKKNKDGEGRHFDRSISEIVVYDALNDNRIAIHEQNGIQIFLSQEFTNDFFLPAIKHKGVKDIVRIPFDELIDTGKVTCEVLFEYQYKNNDIQSALLELTGILTNSHSINAYDSYNECLDEIIPLFARGGIHLPDFQAELLVSQLIFTEDNELVDFSQENVTYKFCTIDKSIHNSPSAITSILYHESSKQIAGAYGTYEKSGTSDYDNFISDMEPTMVLSDSSEE